MDDLFDKVCELVDLTKSRLSNIKPSEWAEQNRIMTSEVSSFPGKFRYDRTPYLREVVDHLSPDSDARVVSVMKGAQIGFALDIDTDIPTPSGWVKMKNIKIGDTVFDEKGNQVIVTKCTDIMYGHECYDVHFSDGSKIKCDAEHLWAVWDDKKHETRKIVVKDTKFLSKSYLYRGNRKRYAIDVCSPIKCDNVDLPIDPYVLGVWIGDGHSRGNRITGEYKDLEFYKSEFKKRGYNTILKSKQGNNISTLAIRKPNDECSRGHKYEKPKISGKNVCRICANDRYKGTESNVIHKRFGEILVENGLYDNKFIPEIYLRASFQQRLDLMCGLMDTDGTIDKNGHCEFYQVDKSIAHSFYELACSLGLKPVMKLRDNTGVKTKITDIAYDVKDIYRISFKAFAEMPVCKLDRKLSRLKKKEDTRHTEICRRRITEISKCESVPVKCISVSGDSHLYLAGKSFIPTHNSTGVIESGIGWIIDQNPGNIMLLTGHADLAEEAMSGKIDQMIDSCGLRPMIKPNTLRKKNQRTGDTNKSKEFPGGSLISGAAGNHKLLRQRSVRYGFIDDYEAAKGSTKESGSTKEMIEQRYAAYFHKMKLYFISTPELKQGSNIEPVYLLGDQRKYNWECPCCGEWIDLRWNFTDEHGNEAGITWKLDKSEKLITDSVGYICQKCGGFFDDSNKFELNLNGKWIPTSEPESPGWYSYHLSSLYAPVGMFDWEYYIRNYLEANPPGRDPIVAKMKTFTNLVLGLTYDEVTKKTDAKNLMMNLRSYPIGVIPESVSIADGNGKIMALTLACDLNGVEDDARLDWELVAWSESGSSYSVDSGSIGTFVPREGAMKHKTDRARWTYDLKATNSVWPEFDKIAKTRYEKDNGGGMYPLITGVDTGHYTKYAYDYIDSTDAFVVGLKGKDMLKYSRIDKDTPIFRPAQERGKLYIVEVNKVKDMLSDLMTLKWFRNDSDEQPQGFMNFPEPSGGKYGYEKFFKHFESEHRIVSHDKDGMDVQVKWEKKSSNSQNHFWDVRIYNMALRDIIASIVCLEAEKIRKGTWTDYVRIMNAVN